MKNDKRAAIQLTVNFLIVLIIGIVIFGMGLRFAYKVLGTATDIEEGLTAQVEQEIDKLLWRGEKVAIPINKADVKIGKGKVFGLGISNKEGQADNFTVTMTYSAFINKEGDEESFNAHCVDDWYFNAPKKYEIKNNENKKIPIAVNVKKTFNSNSLCTSFPPNTPIKRGTYIFNVNVEAGNTAPISTMRQYGSKQKIYVMV